MTEEMLVAHCSPTLAGIKTGSLFSCAYDSQAALLESIRRLNRRLAPKGVRVLPLRCSEKRALIYVFRPSALKRDLAGAAARSLLARQGYDNPGMEPCLRRLVRRLRQDGEFPHEVGLFLGYPPEDVAGFLENRGCGHKCVGCWKVYGDPAAAQKTFEKFRKCTQVYCAQWEQGRSIERLTVAG